jgi:signal transduction histidine kinase
LAEDNKIKEELMEEARLLKAQIAQLKEELDIQSWGLAKTNETIKFLYKELDKLKTDFINIASHELRTPLFIIKEGIAQILDGIHGQIAPEQKRVLGMCYAGVDRLKYMVDDLLDISKIEAGKFELKKEWIDLVSLVKEVSALFNIKVKSTGLELKGNFCSPTAMAYVDKDNIVRVFTNLISNALKFTEQGYIEISVVDKPDGVECYVADTGRGISEEDSSRVFGKFEQFGDPSGAKEKGTGLGLNICKKIVELHQGEIWMESVLGKGTKFTFTFPKNTKKENQPKDDQDQV